MWLSMAPSHRSTYAGVSHTLSDAIRLDTTAYMFDSAQSTHCFPTAWAWASYVHVPHLLSAHGENQRIWSVGAIRMSPGKCRITGTSVPYEAQYEMEHIPRPLCSVAAMANIWGPFCSPTSARLPAHLPFPRDLHCWYFDEVRPIPEDLRASFASIHLDFYGSLAQGSANELSARGLALLRNCRRF
jgi:hypothetical protein